MKKNITALLVVLPTLLLCTQKEAKSNNWVKIQNRNYGTCLNLQQQGNGVGTNSWECVTHPDQEWKITDIGGGFVKIQNRNHGTCLNLQQQGNGAGTNSWECVTHPDQEWKMVSVSSPQSNLFPELSGTRINSNRKSMQGGFAEAKANFYRNGSIVIESKALSESWTQGVSASVFVVGLDQRGRALFISPKFDIPTACSKADLCASNRSENFNHSIGSNLSKYVDKIDVYVDTRGAIGGFRETFTRTIREACASYDELPNSAKNEIGFAGC